LVASALPAYPAQRRRKLFALARKLKARPELVWCGPEELMPLVRLWHERAPASCRGADFDEDWMEFLAGWARARLPEGQGPLEAAWEESGRVALPAAAGLFGRAEVRRLVGLCAQLQKRAGDAPFPLDCRSTGRLLGVGFKTASRWLLALEGAGVLVRTFTGSASSGKANEYRYVESSGRPAFRPQAKT
jgi:hypothetical protein